MTDDDLGKVTKERDRSVQLVAELTARFDEKIEELSLVRQVGDALGSSLDQRTICERTVDLLQEALAPENCSVMLTDHDRANLVLAAARGAFDDGSTAYEPGGEPIVFRMGEGIAGHAAMDQQAIRLGDTSNEPRFAQRPDSEISVRSILCVPLMARATCIGVINLSDSVEDAFEPRHERILAIIANAVAMALQNAQLFYEVTRSRENLAFENKSLRQQLNNRFSTEGLIGNSPEFQAALRLVEKVADTSANVLITGESGTGKEVFARSLHYNSSRHDKPFIAINCAALPETLLEAELFGIEKGVATGVDPRPGTFELANGGTLFLDEIGDMSAAVQVRLLRVLQERKVSRVGARQTVDIDVRVLAATHRNLAGEIEAGRFREDLFYRIKVIEIQLPSLRERRGDVLPLATHFLGRFIEKHGRNVSGFSRSAARAMLAHDWPGNVRQLEHAIEQAVLLAESHEIEAGDLGIGLETTTGIRVDLPEDATDYHDVMADVTLHAERTLITRALAECDGNRTRAAQFLGLSRRALLYKLQRLQLT